jgi:RHS repeat-associated protein
MLVLGTPEAMTDANQNIVWQASYTPFGEATVSINNIENNIRGLGQYFDTETGLHYNYFRMLDPKLGRYLTSDPIGLAGGINTYAHVGNNPINYTDRFGLDAEFWIDSSRPRPQQSSSSISSSSCEDECQEISYSEGPISRKRADRLNANQGHINAAVSTGIGALTGTLAGFVTAGTTATTIGSLVTTTTGAYLTETGTTLHPGDIVMVKYKLCTSDTDFGAQARDISITVIPSN